MGKKLILVAGNGPSSQSTGVLRWTAHNRYRISRTFRTNYFFMPPRDVLGYDCTDWFICQHSEDDLRVVTAYCRGAGIRPTVWVPGIANSTTMVPEEIRRRLPEFDVRVQNQFGGLPAACRWENDLAPQRPLMGSFALAVAVGMKPEAIMFCGSDLFAEKENGSYQGGTAIDTRGKWQDEFAELYRSNKHRNHTLRGDIKYIQGALDAFDGELICFGAEMKRIFADRYAGKGWTFTE